MPSRPLPDVAGGYLARIVGTWEGLPADNLFAFHLVPAPATGATDVAAAQSISDAVAAHWNAFAAANLHNSYRASEATCYPLHTPTHPATVSPSTAAGGLSGDVSSAPLSILVNHAVVRRGRGSQSRSFVQPFTAAAIQTDGRSLIDSFRDSTTANWNTFITAVITDVELATGATCIYSQLSKIPPGAMFAVQSSNAESRLSTQRRRARRNS